MWRTKCAFHCFFFKWKCKNVNGRWCHFYAELSFFFFSLLLLFLFICSGKSFVCLVGIFIMRTCPEEPISCVFSEAGWTQIGEKKNWVGVSVCARHECRRTCEWVCMQNVNACKKLVHVLCVRVCPYEIYSFISNFILTNPWRGGLIIDHKKIDFIGAIDSSVSP